MKFFLLFAFLVLSIILLPYIFSSIKLKNPIKIIKPEYGKFAELKNGNIFYQEFASDNPTGQIVILVHGFSTPSIVWKGIIPYLTDAGYDVIAYDHYGRGFSARPKVDYTKDFYISTLLELIDHLKIEQKVHLIGYSMGGYGALNVAGAGYSEKAVNNFSKISNGNNALEIRKMGNKEYDKSFDLKFKAIVAMAPWGMEYGVWDSEGLRGIKIPTFFIAGSKDDISGYEKGVKAIYDGAINCDRYLLTYINARHNIAPNPPTDDLFSTDLHIDEYLRYADSVWDQRRINNINQHFITAFLEVKLKKKESYLKYIDADLLLKQDPWEGFLPRTSVGMELIMNKKK